MHSVLQKHLAEFTLDTPRALYLSLAQDGIDSVEQHTRFIEVIRESVWSRIEFEGELPPSLDALAVNLLGFQHVESGCQKSREFVRPHSIQLDNCRWEAKV